MPWKVIYFLVIVLCFGVFAGFNMKNTSDINLLFWQFEQIPIYISNLFSFLVGIIIILPFFIGNKKNKKEEKIKQREQEAAGIKTVNLQEPKKKWFQFKKDTPKKTEIQPKANSLDDKEK